MRNYKLRPTDKQELFDFIESGPGRMLTTTLPDLMGGERCPNCGDLKWLDFQVYEKRPHGPKTELKKFHFSCPLCHDHAAFINGMIEKTGIAFDDRFYRVDFFKQFPDKTSFYDWGAYHVGAGISPSGFYMLRGDFGIGKTSMAKAIVLQLAMMGVYTHYINSKMMLSEIMSSFSERKISELQIIRDFDAYKVLAIDEVDVVQDTQYSLSTLRTIIDSRYVSRQIKMTILITNRQDNFWPYLFSRLDDGMIIDVPGKSLRGRDYELRDYLDK